MSRPVRFGELRRIVSKLRKSGNPLHSSTRRDSRIRLRADFSSYREKARDVVDAIATNSLRAHQLGAMFALTPAEVNRIRNIVRNPKSKNNSELKERLAMILMAFSTPAERQPLLFSQSFSSSIDKRAPSSSLRSSPRERSGGPVFFQPALDTVNNPAFSHSVRRKAALDIITYTQEVVRSSVEVDRLHYFFSDDPSYAIMLPIARAYYHVRPPKRKWVERVLADELARIGMSPFLNRLPAFMKELQQKHPSFFA